MPKALDALQPTWLAAFLAVARHRNFTRAAEELRLTQPAVSRQMRALQDALGVRLVEQVGKAITITDAGRAFLDEAQRVRAGLDRAIEAAEAFDGAERGTLRIGASTTPGHYILPRALGEFLRDRPGVHLTFGIRNTHDIEQALVSNELDVGFVGATLDAPELHHEPFLVDHIVVYASRTHPLARQRRILPAALAEHLFVLREKGSGTRALFESWLSAQSVRLERTIELGCPEAIKHLVRAGVGIAFSSCHGLGKESARERLQILDVRGLRIERTISIARHTHKNLSPLLKEFLGHVRATAVACSTHHR